MRVKVHAIVVTNPTNDNIQFPALVTDGKTFGIAGSPLAPKIFSGADYVHLYFTSDEKPKTGDHTVINYPTAGWHEDAARKTVATNNPELWYKERYGVKNAHSGIGGIPEDFIEAFVESNGSIKEVELEEVPNNDSDSEYGRFRLNLDGTVIWKRVEEKMYTREELREIVRNVKWGAKGFSPTSQYDYEEFNEWFDKNYPK